MSSISLPHFNSPFLISSALPSFTYWKTHLFFFFYPSESCCLFNTQVCQLRLQTSWPHVYALSMGVFVSVCIPGRLSALKQKLSVNLVCLYKCLLNPALCIFPSSCRGLNLFKHRQHIAQTRASIFLDLFFI